jgi:hypothetical protein
MFNLKISYDTSWIKKHGRIPLKNCNKYEIDKLDSSTVELCKHWAGLNLCDIEGVNCLWKGKKDGSA